MKIKTALVRCTYKKFAFSALALTVVMALSTGGSIARAGSVSDSPLIARATRLDPADVVVGQPSMSQPIHIEVALKLRNKDLLDAFIANIAKTQAKRQRPQLMTSAQFLAGYAPAAAQAQKVANYLAGAGYTHIVIAPNRLLVSADGTVEATRRAFMTNFVWVHTHDGRMAYANINDVQVPTRLTDTVLAVVGLQNVHRFGTFAQSVTASSMKSGLVSTQAGSVTNHPATDYPWIYGAVAAVANQVSVGILTDGDLSNDQSELNLYASDNGMKPVVQSIVATNGTSSDTTYADRWFLDSVAIVAMINGGPDANSGPAASLIFYNIPSLSDVDVTADLNTIVAANQTKIIEASVTQCETDAQADGTAAAQDAILEAGFAQGQTFAVPAGDNTAHECGADNPVAASWPAASQYVTAVSGTSLNTNDNNKTKYNFEQVWADTGGSPSTFEPMPAWQSSFGVSGATRGVPDVAFAANGDAEYTPLGGGGGGTALSAALFTGTWARILSVWGTSSGPASPILYALPATDFHDVMSVGNSGELAGPGYDFCTGRGSMIIANAIADAGPYINKPPTTTFKITEPTSKTLHFQSNSSDPDGTVVAHYWDFGDGSNSTLTNPTHVYAAAGSYTITETVTDNDGATGSDTQTASTIEQVLSNTGFESGSFSPWKFSATGSGTVVLDNNAADANSGTYSADITYGGGTYLYQTVTIPAGMASATLTVHLHVVDNEPPFHSNDLAVQLRQPGGASIGKDAVLATLGSFSNLDASGGYVTEAFDVTPYIGQQVVVTFQGTKRTDKNPVSGEFAIDDVTLTAQ